MNRNQKRAAAKVASKLTLVPNASGDSRKCGNCAFAQDRQIGKDIVAVRRMNVALSGGNQLPDENPPDVVSCQHGPGVFQMFDWGFCHRHKAKS